MSTTGSRSTRRIFEKQTHANDKGWSVGAEPSAPQTGSEKKQKKSKKISLLTVILVLVAFYASYYIMGTSSQAFPKVIAIAAALFLILTLKKVADWQKALPDKQPLRATLMVFAAVIVNAAIVFISPVNDHWYYLGDTACILILILASVFMMQVYNIGTTRPLPRLFDREEVR